MCRLLLLLGVVSLLQITFALETVNTTIGELQTDLQRQISTREEERVVNCFLGIPYAEAPTGARRFVKPAPKEFLDVKRMVNKFGNM